MEVIGTPDFNDLDGFSEGDCSGLERCWLLNFMLVTIQMILSFLGPKNTTSIMYLNNLKSGLVRQQYTFPRYISPFQRSSSQMKSVVFLNDNDI